MVPNALNKGGNLVGGRGQDWNGGAEKEEVEGGERMFFEMEGEGGGGGREGGE